MFSRISPVLIVSVILVAVALYWRRCRLWSARLRKTISLGLGFPLIGHLHLMLPGKRGILEHLLNMLECKGIFETLAPLQLWLGETPAVIITRPEDVEVLLSSRQISKPSIGYKPVRSFFGDGLITLNDGAWQHHRKVLTPVFHFNILEKYVEVFKRRAENLAEELLQPKFKGLEVDALPILTNFVSNTICETAFGMSVRLAEKEEIKKKEEFLAAVGTAFKIIEKRITKLWYMVDALFYLTPLYTRQQKAEKVINDYSLRIIKMKKEEIENDTEEELAQVEDDVGAKKKVTFLDLVLRDKTNLLSEEEVLQEVRTLVTVQHTTAATMSFVFVMLAIYQDVQEKVFREVQELDLRTDGCSYYERLSELKYLERVIKETMRLYPVTTVFGREIKEDLVLPSCTIPSGCLLGMCVYLTHRDKRFYGPDPNRFDPDHFLPERCRARHSHAYVPFSAGSRNCIGQKYAVLQMKAVVSTIVRKFRIFSGEGCHSQEELHLDMDTFLHVVGGFKVRFEPRET